MFAYSRIFLIKVLIAPVVLGLIFSPFLFYQTVWAVSITTSVLIVYAAETHQIDTTQTFTETLSNPNNTSLDISFPANSLNSGAAVTMTMYSATEESATEDKPLNRIVRKLLR